MTDVIGGVRQSTAPLRLLITSGIILLIFIILPFIVGDFQITLIAKLLLFGILAISLDLVWGFTEFSALPMVFSLPLAGMPWPTI
jgi:urea transport system permease protein